MSTIDLREGLHFTYGDPPDSGVLQQGDVLEKTAKLKDVLREVHPHYFRKSDYSHFMVLTQTCDLVRRGKSGCKAPYITICAVRPLAEALGRFIQKYQTDLDKAARVCKDKHRQKVSDFLERLLNNNEAGYFYLHPQIDRRLPVASCAFLALSIALRAWEHYDVCLDARCLSLAPPFQAKLGWQVGNIYSRVGTEDWYSTSERREAFLNKRKELISEYVRWFPEEKINKFEEELQNAGESIESFSGHREIQERIDKTKVKKKKDRVLERVCEVLRDPTTFRGSATGATAITDDDVKLIKAALNQDHDFTDLLK